MSIPRRQFLRFATLASAGLALPRAARAAGGAPAFPSPPGGLAAYRHWQAQARHLLVPLTKLFLPGHASLDLHGPTSANGVPAERLESFARPMLLAAHYLQSEPETGSEAAACAALRESVARWFREGLVAGTEPGGQHAWGPDANYHQLHVEMGLLALTLQVAPRQLWEPLTGAEKRQVIAWLATARHSGYVDNNHYFMGIHLLEFLRREGHGTPGDDAVIDEYFLRLELMHRGHGWFQDGINQAFDYYNAYAFNFYGLWWARLHGAQRPERARRWRAWARAFTEDYQHFFAASGEHPAFGRSITYRFNSIATFGLAVLEDCTDLPLGRLRRLCTRNLDYFLSRPIYQDQGCLSVGWIDRFEASAELYTCPGSPYWAAKGFAPLLLPSAHPFWHAPEEPLPSETGDRAHVIPAAGLVVRSTGGEVELLNAGSQVSHVNLRYGAGKWSKVAYRTGRAFTCAFPAATHWSADSALTIRLADGRTFGRHSTVPVELRDTYVHYRWALGYAWSPNGPPDQTNVGIDTLLWWNGGWLLQVHRYEAAQPVTFRLGGYALPVPDARRERREDATSFGAWHHTSGGSVVQPLAGFSMREWDERLDESTARTHLAAPFHTTPVTVSARVAGQGWLAALVWTGAEAREGQAWRALSADKGEWRFHHPTLGAWSITHALLPAL